MLVTTPEISLPAVSTPTSRFRIRRSDIIAFVTLAIISSLMFLPFLGHAGMFDPTDSFFVESPREMLQTGQFTVPLFNYDQWLDKPAFAFWLIIASYKLFGINEFAARFPSALSGILIVLSTFVLTRQILNRRQAFLSALVLSTSPLFLIVGHVALTDEPLALFLTVSLLSFAISITKKSFKMLLPAYAALGFAALCKGPMLTLGLVGIVTGAYLVLTASKEVLTSPKLILRSVLRLHPLLGAAIVFAIASPYYIWAHIATNGAFTETFFLRQNIGRMVGVVNHLNPWWWYIPVAIGGFFPWSIALSSGGKFLGRAFKNRLASLTQRQQLLLFSLCWFTVGFVVFSSIPTKLQTYIIPIFPAAAIVMGIYLDVLIRRNRSMPIVVACIGMLLLGGTAPFLVQFLSIPNSGVLSGRAIDVHLSELSARDNGFWVIGGYLASAAYLLGTFLSLTLNRKEAFRCAISVFSAIIFGCGVFIPILSSLYHDKYQANVDDVVNCAHERGANLAMIKFSMPSAIFKYQKKLPLITNESEMQEYANLPGKRWILVHNDVLSLLCWTERSPRVVAHSGKYWLFAVGKNSLKENTFEWNGLLPQFNYPTVAEVLQSKANDKEF